MFTFGNNTIVKNIIDTSYADDPIIYSNETSILNFFKIDK